MAEVPRTWDCFMLYDELDMMTCRLVELEGLNVRHVVTEATRDHHGRPKPLYYGDSRTRFAPWADRIVHNVVSDLPLPRPERYFDDPWDRLNQQRDAQLAGIAGAEPDDVLLLSDIDEIPRPEAITVTNEPMVLEQRLFEHAADWEDKTRLHRGTMMLQVRGCKGTPMDFIRLRGLMPLVPDGGWHLSWLGWPDQVLSKIRVQAHARPQSELDDYANGVCYREGRHDGVRLTPVEVDETWPRWIYEKRCPSSWYRPR
jgi:beta-1,4-mannosyl-glycoprotein beta-1,4-N-acetylglucosaminyltransferase